MVFLLVYSQIILEVDRAVLEDSQEPMVFVVDLCTSQKLPSDCHGLSSSSLFINKALYQVCLGLAA